MRAEHETESRGSIAVMAAPFIALTALDIFMLLFGLQRWVLGSDSRWLVMYGHFLFAPATFWVVTVAARLGKRSWVIGLSSLVLSYLIMTRFRGPWVWQGTLDYWHMSQQPWMLPACIGVVLGITWCTARRESFLSKPYPDDIRFLGALGTCGLLDMAASWLWPFDSIFAPTLHLAIGAVTLLLTGFWFWLVRSEVLIEKGLHTN